MFWRNGIDVGVCACFGSEGHLYLNVPDRFRFSVSVTVPQMCFLPENKSGTSLSVSFIDNTGRRKNRVKLSVRPTVVLRWSVTHSHNMPDPWPLLHIPRQKLQKTDWELQNLKLFGLWILKKAISHNINAKTDNQFIFYKLQCTGHK